MKHLRSLYGSINLNQNFFQGMENAVMDISFVFEKSLHLLVDLNNELNGF